MSKNCGGRGRGWLNLNKNGSTASNINPIVPVGNLSKHITQSTNDENQFVDAQEYDELVDIVKKLNIDDDGIKFNQKIRHLLEQWKAFCPTSDDVEKSFESIYHTCLRDEDLATKLVYLISSRTFISQEVQNKNIRLLFLSKLQQNVDGSDILHKTNSVGFRNCIQMLGDFYYKGRMANGDRFPFLVAPLVENLQVLLKNAQPQDLQLLTAQLFKNGNSIKKECLEHFNKLMNDIRLMLISNNELIKESKLWLLLCIDGSSHRFGILPSELCKFYQENVGEAFMANIQGITSVLSVQTTQNNKTLDSYQSNVNVLQVTSPIDTSNDQLSQFPILDTTNTSLSYSSGFISDPFVQNSSTRFRDSAHNTGKHGRPILGIGSRLNKSKSNNEPNSTWRESSGWTNKPKGEWSDGKKVPKSSKGWEHDDRFENDYS